MKAIWQMLRLQEKAKKLGVRKATRPSTFFERNAPACQSLLQPAPPTRPGPRPGLTAPRVLILVFSGRDSQ